MIPLELFAVADPDGASFAVIFLRYLIVGLTTGALIALIALGYTMVYGIVELINFAHGDVFMLGCCLALTAAELLHLNEQSTAIAWLTLLGMFIVVPIFCAGINLSIDRIVYRPLRNAPKLAPLVSAIGVSFMLMNVGLLWIGPADRSFPQVLPTHNLLGSDSLVSIQYRDLMVLGVTIPVMAALTYFVKYTQTGRAMRATAQNPTAARLMGINVDRVIGATFLIGGALGGVASVIFCLFVTTVGFQMGFTNGLYAFTAAVLGGIGNIPGAVLGGLMIGLVRAFGSYYAGEEWSAALIFAVLILILVFRPAGLLGSRVREKV